MIKAPCKDCPDREVGCHTICKKYLTYREQVDIERKEKIKQKDVISMMSERKVRALERKRKKIGN